jgi:hypothetical protein
MEAPSPVAAGGAEADAPAARPSNASAQLRAAADERLEEGERQALHIRMAILHAQPDVHPLHASRFGGMVDYEQIKQSLRKSHEAFDHDAKILNVRFQPRAGQGRLTILQRKRADETLRRYGRSQGAPRLLPKEVVFAGGSVLGAFPSWREVLAWSAANPAHFCKQRVAGNINCNIPLGPSMYHFSSQHLSLRA